MMMFKNDNDAQDVHDHHHIFDNYDGHDNCFNHGHDDLDADLYNHYHDHDLDKHHSHIIIMILMIYI